MSSVQFLVILLSQLCFAKIQSFHTFLCDDTVTLAEQAVLLLNEKQSLFIFICVPNQVDANQDKSFRGLVVMQLVQGAQFGRIEDKKLSSDTIARSRLMPGVHRFVVVVLFQGERFITLYDLSMVQKFQLHLCNKNELCVCVCARS